jgi:hypothetical protein
VKRPERTYVLARSRSQTVKLHDGMCVVDSWSWEYDCVEVGVEVTICKRVFFLGRCELYK